MRSASLLPATTLFMLALVAVAAPSSSLHQVEAPGSGLCVLPVVLTVYCLPEPRECLDEPVEALRRCLTSN